MSAALHSFAIKLHSSGKSAGIIDAQDESPSILCIFTLMTLPTSKQPAQCIRLIELPAGATGRICSLDGDANLNARLREMGIGESAVLEKISGQHTLLCRLRDVRIALNRQAAQHIWVEKIDPK